MRVTAGDVRVHGTPRRREAQLGSALQRVQAALPALGVKTRCTTGSLPLPEHGLLVSWAMLAPEEPASSTLSWFHSPDCAVLVSGEVFTPGHPARVIAETYAAHGITAVAAADGCFGVVIVDVRAGQVWVASDVLGRRALRWVERERDWLISAHDLSLVAAGGVAVELDPIALVSSAVLESSLGARSLLKGITGLEGNDIVCLGAAARPVRTRLPKLDFSGRLDPRDRDGIRRTRDEAVTSTVEVARNLVVSLPSIRASLTAGLDSRAALAILLGAGARPLLHTVTTGGAHSLDVRTAQRLAQLAGVSHRRPTSTEVATPDGFIEHVRLCAFAMNGDTDAKRATRRVPSWSRDQGAAVEGTAGEVYRGYYYQYFGLTGTVPNDVHHAAQVMLSRRYRRFKRIPLASEHFRVGLSERLHGVFEEYAALSSTGSDLVDLFYVFERCAHWGARAFRSTWSRIINPFLVPSALRAAYRLPAPVGRNSAFHALAIRRYFPAAYWIPVNGGPLLALEGPGKARFATRQALAGFGYLKEELYRRWDRDALTTNHTHADLFAAELHDPIRSLLLSDGSVVAEVFSKLGVERVLREHQEKKNHLAMLGYWVTHAVFEQLARQLVPGSDSAT